MNIGQDEVREMAHEERIMCPQFNQLEGGGLGSGFVLGPSLFGFGDGAKNDPQEYTKEEREKDALLMEEHFGWKLPRMMGFQVLVRICTRGELHLFRDKDGNAIKSEEGKSLGLIIPDELRKHDMYSSNVGLVCAMGPSACRSTKSYYYGPRFRIGDYVTFPPSAGLLTPFKGIPFKTFLDEQAIMQVDNPEDVLVPLNKA